MDTVTISQREDGWTVDVNGGPRYVYGRLADATRRAGREVSESVRPGSTPSTTWNFTDDFMREALELARARAQLAEDEARVARETSRTIVSLAKHGLSNGDIATVLGITAARVSQIVMDTAEWLWGSDDPEGDVQYAKIKFGAGWKAARGRGPLPSRLQFMGETYVRTGTASQVNGQPWRHTYLPEAEVPLH